MNYHNLTTWVDKFKKGDFNKQDIDVQIDAGWYNWFCKDTSLYNKTKQLGKYILEIFESNKIGKKFDSNNCYVFFKNNCPAYGKLYDSFSICSINGSRVLYWISPKIEYDNKPGYTELCKFDEDDMQTLISDNKNGMKKIYAYFRGEN